jgi:redox-sensitive bicupin YhaK (pirin superfamily)
MEIITIPIRGSLKHGDSMGNTTVISAGEIQMMSAGTGVVHSEYNNSTEESVEFLQIWVIPSKRNTEPRYQQISYADKQKNMLHQLIGPDTESPIQIHQDAHIHLGTFDQDMQTKLERASENKLMYIFVIDGTLSLDGVHYARRDAAMITDTAESIDIDVTAGTTLLVFELPEL